MPGPEAVLRGDRDENQLGRFICVCQYPAEGVTGETLPNKGVFYVLAASKDGHAVLNSSCRQEGFPLNCFHIPLYPGGGINENFSTL